MTKRDIRTQVSSSAVIFNADLVLESPLEMLFNDNLLLGSFRHFTLHAQFMFHNYLTHQK